MEYIGGGTIKEYLTKNGNKYLDLLLIQILSGLEYLHNEGIVHRDIDPNNILIDDSRQEPVAKITDFGISRDSASEGKSSMLVGKPHFMAPEQLAGKPATFSVDLWAFGVLVYVLLKGKFPFDGIDEDNTTALQMRIAKGELPDDIKTLPEPYKSVVTRCLVVDVKQRVQSASQLIPILKAGQQQPISNAVEEVTKKDPVINRKKEKPENQTSNSGDKTELITNTLKKPKDEPKTKQRTYLIFTAASIIVCFALWFIVSQKNNKPTPDHPTNATGKSITTQSGFDPNRFVEIDNTSFRTHFLLAKAELTVAEFAAFVDETNYKTQVELHPELAHVYSPTGEEPNVNGLNWKYDSRQKLISEPQSSQLPCLYLGRKDMQSYCSWLANKWKKKVRVPTVTEWLSTFTKGDSAAYSNPSSIGVLNSKSVSDVKQKSPIQNGVYDLIGNVYEMVDSGENIIGGCFLSESGKFELIPFNEISNIVGFRILVEI